MPELLVEEAKRERCPLAAGAVLLINETSGGNSWYGHDYDACMSFRSPWRDVEVTRENYENEYLPCVKAGGKRNGVGPMQLTFWALQEEADKEGGCWDPRVNIRIGCRYFVSCMRAEGSSVSLERGDLRAAFGRYNGGPNWRHSEKANKYADKAQERFSRWEAVVWGKAPEPPALPPVAVDVKPVAYWRDRFDKYDATFWQEHEARSRTGDSWRHYNLAYGVDAYTSMYEATGDNKYLIKAIILVENLIEVAEPVPGGYRGWRSQREDTRGQEVPLFESYCWRYVCRLLRVMPPSPQRDGILEFVKRNIWDRWTRKLSNVYRVNTHMRSHWLAISRELTALGVVGRPVEPSHVAETIDAQIHRQMQLWDDGGYWWDSTFGRYQRPGQDVAHGNGTVSNLVASQETGGRWTRDDMLRLCGTLRRITPKAKYVDGSGAGTGWLADGWVKLGRYDVGIQRLLEAHPVQTQSQYMASMAVNARVLGA